MMSKHQMAGLPARMHEWAGIAAGMQVKLWRQAAEAALQAPYQQMRLARSMLEAQRRLLQAGMSAAAGETEAAPQDLQKPDAAADAVAEKQVGTQPRKPVQRKSAARKTSARQAAVRTAPDRKQLKPGTSAAATKPKPQAGGPAGQAETVKHAAAKAGSAEKPVAAAKAAVRTEAAAVQATPAEPSSVSAGSRSAADQAQNMKDTPQKRPRKPATPPQMPTRNAAGTGDSDE